MKAVILFLMLCGCLTFADIQAQGPPYADCAHVGHQNYPNQVDGWYPITLSSGVCLVYCQFGAPPYIWDVYALMESYPFQNNFAFRTRSFTNDSVPGINHCTEDFNNYRLQRADMVYYSNRPESTHWMATCNLDIRRISDYWLVSFAEYNFLTISNDPASGCVCCAEEVNIRGHSCSQFTNALCDVPFVANGETHIYIDSNYAGCAGHGTEQFPWVASSISSEDSFGYYLNVNTNFGCAIGSGATSNYWIRQTFHEAVAGGDPHFETLDGLKYNYDGPCSYIALTNKCKKKENEKSTEYPLFEVLSHHGRCMRRTKGIVCIKKVTVQVWKDKESKVIKLEIESKENIKINGYEMKLPYHSVMFDVIMSDFTTNDQNYQRIDVVTEFGLSIKWSDDGAGIFDLAMPSNIRTCGLLGNNNGNVKDDLELRNGTILKYKKLPMDEKISNIMGDSWMIKTKNQVLQCHLYPSHSMQSQPKSICSFDFTSVQESCEQMIQTQFKALKGSKVKTCFKPTTYDNRIDSARIYDDCITEVCSCKEDLFKDCIPTVAINEFKDICLKNGITNYPDIIWEFE